MIVRQLGRVGLGSKNGLGPSMKLSFTHSGYPTLGCFEGTIDLEKASPGLCGSLSKRDTHRVPRSQPCNRSV